MDKHFDLSSIKRVHFIGVGGVSMSGLAETLYRNGFIVSGSDRSASPATRHLSKMGIDVMIGADAKNITKDIDLVVYTAAIKADNPELVAAGSMGIPIMVRAELLGALLQSYEYAVCVAGTHGKTSTTALITDIALKAGLDPTVNIGGYIGDTNYYIGNSPYFILEACEYSNSFHYMKPYIGVILNIDEDHMDFHGSIDAIIESFAVFARNIRPGGMLVIQDSIPGFDKITAGLTCRIVTFSTGPVNAPYGNSTKNPGISCYWARNIVIGASGTPSFDIMEGDNFQARVDLPLPGIYNMHNALAAYAATRALGVEPADIAASLSKTRNVKRRYEYKGIVNGTAIVDDYAHHPTEIKACLAAARSTNPKRIICLFQPHTYTRTRNHFDDFAKSFTEADIVLFVPIYAAREPFDPTITSEMLAKEARANGSMTVSLNSLEEAEGWLRGKLMPDDLLITMGAGDVYLVGERLLSK